MTSGDIKAIPLPVALKGATMSAFGTKRIFSALQQFVRYSSDCVAKLFAAIQSRNNQIRLNGALNQCCALASVLESLLLVSTAKIVLQHIPSNSGHWPELTLNGLARYRLPAVYPYHTSVTAGSLASYGTDILDDMRKTAGYIDRILKGEKAADLPVQVPTKYELAINLKTSKALGLTLASTLLARSDEVIE